MREEMKALRDGAIILLRFIKIINGLSITCSLPYLPTTNTPCLTQTHKDPESDTVARGALRTLPHPFQFMYPPPLLTWQPSHQLCTSLPSVKWQEPQKLDSWGYSTPKELTTCGNQAKSCHLARMTVNLPEQQGLGAGSYFLSHGRPGADICRKWEKDYYTRCSQRFSVSPAHMTILTCFSAFPLLSSKFCLILGLNLA